MPHTRDASYHDHMCGPSSPHHGFDSSSSDREALMGGASGEDTSSEKTWTEDHHHGHGHRAAPRARAGRLRRCCAAFMSVRSLVDSVLLVVILVLLLERTGDSKWGSGGGGETGKESVGSEFEGNGDITGFAPRMAQQITKFSPDPGFAPENASEFFTDAVQKKWLSIVPKGLGYVKVPSPSLYNNLPTPLKGYHPTTYTTSVTHQLHCLHAILSVYNGITSNNTHKMSHDGPWHLSHCFEYLRQSIMCCGDTALEGQQTTFPPGFVGSDGWDAKHVCKDWGQVKGYLEENRQNDDKWI